MELRSVLISGAGIAGPALAFWLQRLGIETTVIERSASIREGGQAVDFRGDAHRTVLERMDFVDRVHAHRTRALDLALLDPQGRVLGQLPASFMAGDVEIARGDLVRLLHDATRESTHYRFGDAIASLCETDAGVDVTFEHARPQRFDAVIGADGIHSHVRALAFTDEAACTRYHGCQVALFVVPDTLDVRDTSILYGTKGRGVMLSPDADGTHAHALFAFRAPPGGPRRDDEAAQRACVLEAFEAVGWKVPRLLDATRAGKLVYFDAIASVVLPRYTTNRIALLGDAAWGGTLGGQGTGVALVGAHVLAGELADAHGHLPTAFAQYEQRMRAYATRCQKGAHNAGGFLAPATAPGLWARNQFYRIMAAPRMRRLTERMTTSAARDIVLPDYRTLLAA